LRIERQRPISFLTGKCYGVRQQTPPYAPTLEVRVHGQARQMCITSRTGKQRRVSRCLMFDARDPHAPTQDEFDHVTRIHVP
jgi:hypothetical protein